VILGYYEDSPNLVSMAMNGWGAAEPAWGLNLQVDPQAVIELADGASREVRVDARTGTCAVGRPRSRSPNTSARETGSTGRSPTSRSDMPIRTRRTIRRS
jgi:hypothetical protein